MEALSRYILSKRIIYYLLGLLETLLIFRFIFRLLGANPQSGFVAGIYAVTGGLLAPFLGIFSPFVTRGAETQSVFEPATLIGMLVYALLAWGLVRLLELYLTKS